MFVRFFNGFVLIFFATEALLQKEEKVGSQVHHVTWDAWRQSKTAGSSVIIRHLNHIVSHNEKIFTWHFFYVKR